jgi:hypothetical protein
MEPRAVGEVRARTPDVWLTGQRWNERYRFDRNTGTVVGRAEVTDHWPGDGVGSPCGRRFVAVYVDPDSDDLMLQVGKTRVRLDDDVSAIYRRTLAGMRSELTIRAGADAVLSLSAITPARFVLRRVDPGYDELDELNDDFLMDVADIVNSRERQDAFRSARDRWEETH